MDAGCLWILFRRHYNILQHSATICNIFEKLSLDVFGSCEVISAIGSSVSPLVLSYDVKKMAAMCFPGIVQKTFLMRLASRRAAYRFLHCSYGMLNCECWKGINEWWIRGWECPALSIWRAPTGTPRAGVPSSQVGPKM